MIVNVKILLERFTKNNCKKQTNKQKNRFDEVFNRKGDKLYVKWQRYDNSFQSWIDKKDMI